MNTKAYNKSLLNSVTSTSYLIYCTYLATWFVTTGSQLEDAYFNYLVSYWVFKFFLLLKFYNIFTLSGSLSKWKIWIRINKAFGVVFRQFCWYLVLSSFLQVTTANSASSHPQTRQIIINIFLIRMISTQHANVGEANLHPKLFIQSLNSK